MLRKTTAQAYVTDDLRTWAAVGLRVSDEVVTACSAVDRLHLILNYVSTEFNIHPLAVHQLAPGERQVQTRCSK